MNASTETSIVSVPPASAVEAGGNGAEGGQRRSWLWWFAGGLLLCLAGAVFAAFTVNIPYYEFRPGSARPTAELVVVDEDKAFLPASDIAFTTVSLRHSTVASYVWAWFDDDIEVVDDEVVLGNRSPTENRQFNLQLMDTSKQEAIRVALLELGYEVPVSIEGVVVVEVEDGSAADGVLSVGDTIVSIDGRELTDTADVSDVMAGKAPGTTVTLGVEPPDRTEVREVHVVLGTDEEGAERGVIGVRLQPRDPQYQYPFDIDIDSGTVGGPSAGLAFSLGIVDLLTPGELTGGLQVAVTGTIDQDGKVGPVGGVKQKTAVVLDEGYDVFIVPRREADQVSARAGDRLTVIGVDTLEEALDALASLGGSGLGTSPGADSQPG